MKQKHFIDFHKGITFLYILYLINYYVAYENTTIWVYLGLHGTYGVLWVLKSMIFPDKSWEVKAGFLYGLFILAGLSLYWISPWILYQDILIMGIWLRFPCGLFQHVYFYLAWGFFYISVQTCRSTLHLN